MAKIVICKECGEEGKHRAFGLCNRCHWKQAKKKKLEKPWSQDDLEYICKFSFIGDTMLAEGIGRPTWSVTAKLKELKANGKYEEYIKSYLKKMAE
ncbi:hypothetical protein [Sediminibacillus massiliensis]|uniref:hypothetical protein n=1 Tax=Sediminibacillus massiliensis TaxID=1926277 RepID=UPI0009887566|nr:hypothetical protein [Sediminibacillus massiliensis]